MKSQELAKEYKDYVINMRREFHMNPEPSLQEYETSKKIKNELEKDGIECEIVADTGVVATIRGAHSGKTIALRGDIDALAVIEQTGKEYASKVHGLMHACGHDSHGAMLLGAAKILNRMKDEINGTVKLFFQPGEEVVLGAKKMIAAGVMEGVDAIMGIHVSSDVPSGQISADSGARMASGDMFKITVTGKGGHGARPEQCIDAVVVGSAIVMNLQSVISREYSPFDPAVLTVGEIKSGTRFNVIAPTAVLTGTTRCYSPEVRKNFFTSITRIAKSTAEAYRATAEVEFTEGVGPTINDDNCAALARETAASLVGKENVVTVPPSTGGEDFSFFSNIVPGVMVKLGTGNKEKGTDFPHHHEKFDIDEDMLEVGTALYAQFALNYLSNNK